jgi:hypothetical protein
MTQFVRLPLAALTFSFLLACGSSEASTDPALLNPPDSGLVWVHYSPEEAVATFGRYRVDLTPVVPPPTATPDGEFVTAATSPAGHRVGRIEGRLAIWLAGAASPAYMFPPDTNESDLVATQISDRKEVLLVSGQYSATIYTWLDNELKKAYGPDCLFARVLNARGMIGANTICRLYNSGFTVLSAFSPDNSRSGRFAGETCNVGGRYSSIIAIDDDNEILRTVERRPGGGSVTTVAATGCIVLDDRFAGLPLVWNALRSGLIGGHRAATSGFTIGVITDGVHIGAVNDLLTADAAAEWRILSVTGIGAGASLRCQAISVRDGHTTTLTLVRDD